MNDVQVTYSVADQVGEGLFQRDGVAPRRRQHTRNRDVGSLPGDGGMQRVMDTLNEFSNVHPLKITFDATGAREPQEGIDCLAEPGNRRLDVPERLGHARGDKSFIRLAGP